MCACFVYELRALVMPDEEDNNTNYDDSKSGYGRQASDGTPAFRYPVRDFIAVVGDYLCLYHAYNQCTRPDASWQTISVVDGGCSRLCLGNGGE